MIHSQWKRCSHSTSKQCRSTAAVKNSLRLLTAFICSVTVLDQCHERPGNRCSSIVMHGSITQVKTHGPPVGGSFPVGLEIVLHICSAARRAPCKFNQTHRSVCRALPRVSTMRVLNEIKS